MERRGVEGFDLQAFGREQGVNHSKLVVDLIVRIECPTPCAPGPQALAGGVAGVGGQAVKSSFSIVPLAIALWKPKMPTVLVRAGLATANR